MARLSRHRRSGTRKSCSAVVSTDATRGATPLRPFHYRSSAGSRVAAPEKPFLGILIDLDPIIVAEVAARIGSSLDDEESRTPLRAFFTGDADDGMVDAAVRLARALDAPELARWARTASMSRSAFFQHFKDITAMSPVQYQKRLRLLEARRLMVDEDETAERSSFRVGYGSASQFSREYVRMFGESPRRDTSKIKRVGSGLREL
jgi:AraC-like DNA-binding protein